jgi:hypothetical protein
MKKGYIATIDVPPTHKNMRRWAYDDNYDEVMQVTRVAWSRKKIARKVREYVEERALAHHRLDTILVEFDVTL